MSKTETSNINTSDTGVNNSNNNSSGKARSFIFTLNNPENKGYTEERVEEVLKNAKAKKYIFQLERGTSGTPHFQGVVTFNNPRHMSKIIYLFQYDGRPCAHWEICRSLTASWKYCSKKDTRIGNVITTEQPMIHNEPEEPSLPTGPKLSEYMPMVIDYFGVEGWAEQQQKADHTSLFERTVEKAWTLYKHYGDPRQYGRKFNDFLRYFLEYNYTEADRKKRAYIPTVVLNLSNVLGWDELSVHHLLSNKD